MPQRLHVGSYGEQGCRLQIGAWAAQTIGRQAASREPAVQGLLHVHRVEAGHIAPKGIGKTIRTHGISRIAHRHKVDTHAIAQGHLPVVLRHPRNNVVAAIVPTLAHISIFNPHIVGGRCGTVDEQGVLCEHRSLRFNAPLQYIALVFYQILYSHRRGYHVRPRAIVVELATRQGQYGHRQVGQSGIGARRILTQCATKVAIQVVVARQRCKISARCAALATIGSGLTLLHQALDSLVAEQPHPDVHQHQVRGHQFGLLCGCRLLQHKVELCGRLAVHQKHAMV